MAVTQNTSINLVVDQGADFSKNLTVTTDGSTAYDISGLTFNGQVRPSYDSSTLTATFTISMLQQRQEYTNYNWQIQLLKILVLVDTFMM